MGKLAARAHVERERKITGLLEKSECNDVDTIQVIFSLLEHEKKSYSIFESITEEALLQLNDQEAYPIILAGRYLLDFLLIQDHIIDDNNTHPLLLYMADLLYYEFFDLMRMHEIGQEFFTYRQNLLSAQLNESEKTFAQRNQYEQYKNDSIRKANFALIPLVFMKNNSKRKIFFEKMVKTIVFSIQVIDDVRDLKLDMKSNKVSGLIACINSGNHENMYVSCVEFANSHVIPRLIQDMQDIISEQNSNGYLGEELANKIRSMQEDLSSFARMFTGFIEKAKNI